MKTCAVCSAALDPSTSEPYRIGSCQGSMCLACSRSMETAICAWMRKRLREVESERAEQAKAERARQEKAAASLLAKEIAHTRLAQLANEALPIATRGEMARYRRLGAA